MNAYKKLILSLTITLLSTAGVVVAAKPDPKITTSREFGIFISQYPQNQFLTNAKSGFDNGLLQILVSAYDKLPEGAKAQAQTYIRSRFGTGIQQLKAKLATFDQGRDLAAELAEAQQTIATIKREKAELQAQVGQIEQQTTELNSEIASYKGKVADLKVIAEKYEDLKFAMFNLENHKENLKGQRDNLQRKIAELRKENASAQQLKPLQDQLAATEQDLTKAQATVQQSENRIKQLEQKIKNLEAKLPADQQAQIILGEYDALLDRIESYIKTGIATINIPDDTAIAGMDDAAIAKQNADLISHDQNLDNALVGIGKELDELEAKWAGLQINPTSALGQEQPKKIQKAEAALNAIDAKRAAIRKALQALGNRAQQLFKNDNDQKAAEVNAKLNQVLAEYENAFKETRENTILFGNVTLGQYTKEPSLLASVTDAEELKDTPEKLDALIKKTQALNQTLSPQIKNLEAQAQTLQGLDASQQEIIDDLLLEAQEMAEAAQRKIPERFDAIKKVIAAKVAELKQAQTKPDEPVKPVNPPAEEVSDVEVETKNKPFNLRFVISGVEYSVKTGNAPSEIEFAQNISKLDANTLTQAGEKIVAVITGDSEAKDQSLQLIFGQILYNPYFRAKKLSSNPTQKIEAETAMTKLRILVKPIFEAYTDKTNSIYTNFEEKWKQ